jgi:putative transposase
MKRSRFTKEQIIGALREHEAGGKTTEICRRWGSRRTRSTGGKAKYGGMEALGFSRREK